MYILDGYYVCMPKRTTVEIDEDLLARAKRALALRTTRETVEESLRRVVAHIEDENARRAAEQRAFLEELPSLIDLDVLSSEEMWR